MYLLNCVGFDLKTSRIYTSYLRKRIIKGRKDWWKGGRRKERNQKRTEQKEKKRKERKRGQRGRKRKEGNKLNISLKTLDLLKPTEWILFYQTQCKFRLPVTWRILCFHFCVPEA